LSSLNISGLTILNNVGIGIDNPNNKLEISGIDTFRISDYRELGEPSIEFVKGSGERPNKIFGSSYHTDWKIKVQQSGELSFHAKSLDRAPGYQIDGVVAKISNYGSVSCSNVNAGTVYVGQFEGGSKITLGNYQIGSVINLLNDGSITCQSLSVANNSTIGGNLSCNSLTIAGKVDGYITSRAPIFFTTSRTVTINGINFSAYDLNLNSYTKFLTLDGRKIRQFRLRSWHASGDFENYSAEVALNYNIYMSDLNGLSIKSFSAPYTNYQLDQVNSTVPTFIRNSFDFITYLAQLNIYGSNIKVYCIFEDLL
jgi:hypothetical protein